MQAEATSAESRPDHEIAIIGAGLSGLGVAAQLSSAGLTEFVILERAGDIGGTWRDNTYPGVACDIPAHAYQFGFFLNPDWSRLYAPGAEIKRYMDDLVAHYGLRRHLRLNTEVSARFWDEERHLWRLELASGDVVTARWCIGAIGAFCEPSPVKFAGADRFRGKLMHSSQWDPDYDLNGKRVACIGTGASALQLIPEIAGSVAHLDVYQRTPIWVGYKWDPQIPARLRRLMRRSKRVNRAVFRVMATTIEGSVNWTVVHYDKAERMVDRIRKLVRRHHVTQITDPAMLAKLTPEYQYACKRPSFSNTYLPALQMDHVEVVTEPIEQFTPDGIRTVDGEMRPVDAVILATGFIGANEPVLYRMRPIRGRDGFDLAEHWETNRLTAYQGISVPQLPNHFIMFGPYSAVGGAFHRNIEVSADHIIRLITEARRRGATAVEVTERASQAYHATMLERHKSSIWHCAPCRPSNTYYYGPHGDVILVRPATTKEAFRMARTFDFADYRFDVRGIAGDAGSERPMVGTNDHGR